MTFFISTTARWTCFSCLRAAFRRSYSTPRRRTGVVRPRLDYKTLLHDPEGLKKNAELRKADPSCVTAAIEYYSQFRNLEAEVKQIRTQKNQFTSKIEKHILGENALNKEEFDDIRAKLGTLKQTLFDAEHQLKETEENLRDAMLAIPNSTHPHVPLGDQFKARQLWERGRIRMSGNLGFELLDHMELGKKLDIIDFESGAIVSGSSWYYLCNQAALLELALIQYAMTRAVSAGFKPIITPDVVRNDFVSACGFNPRVSKYEKEPNQTYKLDREVTGLKSPELALVGTAEIPLAGMQMDRTFKIDELPLKYVAFGRAFRAECGARGKETRGLYRVHQFSKVELFAVTTREQSEEMLKQIVDFQAGIFDSLGLATRLMDMPTEELGSSAYRKFDIETWMPGRKEWGEISSASNCTDYQSRRLNITYEDANETEQFVHTLNGTAMAVPRMILAILENYQKKDGTVGIPSVLLPYMCGLKDIRRRDK